MKVSGAGVVFIHEHHGSGRVESSVERELVLKCQAGEARFFEPLVRAFEAEAVRIARALLGDGDAARDAAQEAFLKAFRALHQFDAARSFRPWFLQILRNQCRDELRSRRARDRIEVRDATSHGSAIAGQADVRDQARRDASDMIRRGLARLDDAEREIIVLKDLIGLSYAEIAEQLDIPEGTVASRLHHARGALRAALESLGVFHP